MSVELFLVRHGESEWNREKRLTGWTDVALTETGRRQAESLRDLLAEHHFDAVWSSDLERAWMTGELAGFADSMRVEELREFHFGIYEGEKFMELSRELTNQFRNFETFVAPEGETGSAFYERIDRFFDELPAGRHLIFAHGGVVRSALRHTAHERFVANAGITQMNWTNRTFVTHTDNPYRPDES